MTKNPIINALAASAYVALVALFFSQAQTLFGPAKDTPLAPLAMLSLLTLSVAVMSGLFFYQPFRLYFDGDKAAAARLFLGTVAAFAILTVLAFVLLATIGSGA